ncbi:MAG: head decoration protein [Boseongicola sp.]|nr:head decoration protein [Boseongicola sp.]
MPVMTEGQHTGEFIVSEGNGTISRETVTILNGRTLEAGAILGKVTASGKYREIDPVATSGAEAEDNKAESKTDDNVVDLDQVRAQERTATLAYVSEVNQLCALAGSPEMASGFIAKATSTEKVRAALLQARAEEDEASAVSATGRSQTPKPGEPTIDTAAIYAARNKTAR